MFRKTKPQLFLSFLAHIQCLNIMLQLSITGKINNITLLIDIVVVIAYKFRYIGFRCSASRC